MSWHTVNHKANYKVDHKFELRIILQPSHILFILENTGNATLGWSTHTNKWKHYYGYFYEETDKNNHQDEFTDSMFETVHIEGDAEIETFKVKSGGSLNQSSDIPSYVIFKPYENKMFTAINKTRVDDYPTNKYLFYDQNVSNRIGTPKGAEYEIILRGRVLEPRMYKFIQFEFQEKSEKSETICTVVSIRAKFMNDPKKTQSEFIQEWKRKPAIATPPLNMNPTMQKVTRHTVINIHQTRSKRTLTMKCQYED